MDKNIDDNKFDEKNSSEDRTEIDVNIEYKDEMGELAAFILSLYVVGCGLSKSVAYAKSIGLTTNVYIARRYMPSLYQHGVITFYKNMPCIGNKGIRIIEECARQLDCIKERLATLLR